MAYLYISSCVKQKRFHNEFLMFCSGNAAPLLIIGAMSRFGSTVNQC